MTEECAVRPCANESIHCLNEGACSLNHHNHYQCQCIDGYSGHTVHISVYLVYLLLGGIASCSASDSAYSYTFLRSVVCLSVVCHTRAPCLNRSTDLDAIWQVSALEVIFNVMRSINPRFTYLLTYLLTLVGSNDTLC